ncbi:hypothetical protein F442_00670 [Phytophthora nicotianae P10297]|uniref:Peptidase S33 tripeptidyl aminopeptidase-like C-terminal domain-containing protein n=2 Tax=Phytophthora nicotianae TaxID=4792 RepID=W3A676_PHYNI|nr:hypothetical protein F444_00708 [Phytophthora nicotianae P1976]ETP54681.1 hypothetical protein F442_00670 [Phytophthora nicotianae P10297]
MQLHCLLAVVTVGILGHTSAALNGTLPNHPLNGWYPCHDFTFSDTAGSTGQEFSECAVYTAPLCYPGICEPSEFAKPTVDIFVKRLPATVGDAKTAHNVWLLEGGPGYASNKLETRLVELHTLLEGAVNVYTMDHRGTGRSTLLECVAAQITTTGSTLGIKIHPSEVPSCARELQMKYGDLASFSTTSAAMDISSFISKFSNGASSIVYGKSYGTVVVERLMLLNTPTVAGYVLDGVVTTSAASPKYISNWDDDVGEVAEHFMELCEQDSTCGSHFQSANLSVTLQDLITRIDNDPNSTCAALLSNWTDSTFTSPSSVLRKTLSEILKSTETRTLIPPVVYRLNRCDSNDVEILNQFFTTMNSPPSSEETPFRSELLFRLIIFSELWQRPSPSTNEMETRFTNASIADGIYEMLPLYCAFSKEKSATCDELRLGNYEGEGIIYQRDQYWGKRVKIPTQASVLLMSGKLDPQTAHKYAEYLLDALDGSNKELITFDYAPHIAVSSNTLYNDATGITRSCGMDLLASYVSNNGDLQHLDRSCMSEMTAFNLTVPIEYVQDYFGTNEAYDGVYDASFSLAEE